jgi:hypothetical protein
MKIHIYSGGSGGYYFGFERKKEKTEIIKKGTL